MELNYTAIGATTVASPTWPPTPPGFRRFERSVQVGAGAATWHAASSAAMEWGVKTRSGFEVAPASGQDITVREGRAYTLIARFGPLAIREPVQVVAVVRRQERVGFAYGTGVGHPVSGEEAFVVWRDEEDRVWLTLRSLTRPSAGLWRRLFPLLLIAQRWYRSRYLRALVEIEPDR